MASGCRAEPVTALLDGRVALITGAAGGIGSEIARSFVRAGARVLANDLDARALEQALGEPAARGTVTLVGADLAAPGVPARLVQSAVDAWGRIDILINNAAVIVRHDIFATDEQLWERTFAVNLKAAFFLGRYAAEHMRRNRWGRIVNLASQAGHSGGAADCPAYAIAKGGMMTMTRSFARALAGEGITVNAVAPGIVMTEMIAGTLPRERIEELVAGIPVGRPSTAAEIAAAVLFLASEDAATITGHVLDVNGGMLMR